MATYRIGIGSFNLKDGAVGIGTESSGLGNLKVEGTYKTTDLDVTGVSTFTRYAGFAADDLNIVSDTSLTGEHSTLGDIVVGINSIFTVSTGATVTVGTVESVSIGTHFSPPTGGVEERPEVPVEGTVRFNKDLNTLEFYNGFEWRQFTVSGASGRGLMAGGITPAYTSDISYITISTAGNAIHFGDLTQARTPRGCSSSTRAIFSGGFVNPTGSNILDYNTIASLGNSFDFGDSTHQRRNHTTVSSSTRGLFMGGESPADLNVIDYVEIPTLGNALDFGDLTANRKGNAPINSPVRGMSVGDQNDYNTTSAEFVIMASKGNAVDFGQLDDSRANGGACSNTVKGLYIGGYNGGSRVTLISSCIIASQGNFVSFGDLVLPHDCAEGMASQTRAVYGAGYPDSTYPLESIEFATGGQAITFGAPVVKRGQASAATSDSHGGLGGY